VPSNATILYFHILLFTSLHVSASTGHPQVKYTRPFLKAITPAVGLIFFLCVFWKMGVCVTFEYDHHFSAEKLTVKTAVGRVNDLTESVSDFARRVLPAVRAAFTNWTLEFPEV
jgi:hypothetical protein